MGWNSRPVTITVQHCSPASTGVADLGWPSRGDCGQDCGGSVWEVNTEIEVSLCRTRDFVWIDERLITFCIHQGSHRPYCDLASWMLLAQYTVLARLSILLATVLTGSSSLTSRCLLHQPARLFHACHDPRPLSLSCRLPTSPPQPSIY